MSGTINPLLWQASMPDTMVGDTVPLYGGGGPRELPTRMPEGFLYQGAIPTPPSDYGPTILNMPHDYQRMRELLRPNDPAVWNQLLRMIYWNRNNTRG